MNQRRAILFVLFVLALLSGAIDGYRAINARPTSSPLDLIWAFAFGGASFAWYYFDALQVRFKRSKLLDVLVIALAFLAIPYYLFRSRPKGKRLRAVGLCLGFIVILIVATVVGGMAGEWAHTFTTAYSPSYLPRTT